MKTKKLLSALLCVALLAGTVAGTVAMPTIAAAQGTTNVPFGSPAIKANVGETIDLTKYGVEFSNGNLTDSGLTWWKNTASSTVPFKSPAILANVGETVNLTDWSVEFADGVATDAANISWQKKLDPKTVTFGMPAILTNAGTKINFAEYPVELTEGNIVSGSKLTWTQTEVSNDLLITYTSPAIPANVGDVVDLTKYAVEFENGVATRPAEITWKNGDTAVTSFTPNAKGVTALTAAADGVTKTIYVVAKNAEDTKYVLYRNDFDSADAVAEMHKSTMGTAAATATYADGGYLSHLRNGAATATNQSMLFAPDWLCDFGAYRLEARVSVSAYGNTGRYFSFLTHGSNTAQSGPYYVAGFVKNGAYWFQKNASATKWGLTNLSVTISKASAFTMNVNTYYTYALEYGNNTVASYIDGTQIMESVASDATPIVTGRPGIGFHGVDATADYFEVALVDGSIKTATYVDTATSYTPDAKGVTAFEVSDGETTKTVYVVAKNAEDTEYVLYENDFNEAEDLDDLTVVIKNEGTQSIANGKLSFVRGTTGTWTATNNHAYFLPEWLCDFGDYTLEMNATVNAQGSDTRYIGFLYRGQPGSDARPYIITAFARNKQVIWGDRSTAETGWHPNWYTAKANAYTIPAFGTAATYKLTVAGDALSVFYNGTEVASTVLPDTAPEMGRPGIMTAGVDFDIDNYKVVLTESAKTEAVTAFTPQAAGVTEFTATVNGVSKSVYVVAKEESDTEYVLYQNDFDTAAALSDVTRLAGGTDANYPLGISDGNLTITRVNNNSGNTTIGFPMWLADFGDYTIETSLAVTAQTNTSRYYGVVFRGNPTDSYAPHYVSIYKRNGVWQGQTRVSTTAADWNASWDNWAGPSITGAFSAAALNTYATHKVEVKGDTATAYYNGTEVGTYTPTDMRDTGFVGLFLTAMDMKVDYFKVTLSATATEAEQITTFTPDKAGVTALTVKDAEGNEKTVYVVAKNAEDTEYVLYENTFDNAYDANTLNVAEGAATLSVANGKLTVATSGAYVYLPAFLGDFGDYKMQMVASTTEYGASSDWLAFLARGQHTDSAKETYVARVRHSSGAWDAAGYYYRDADATMHRHEWGGHATISKGSTHTYTLLAQGDLITLKQDNNYVFYAAEPKEQRIGQIGFATSNVTLSVDSIRVTLSDIEKPVAPVSASFAENAGLPYGTVAGNLTVNLAADGDAAVDVVYYWGDGEGKLDGYGAFDKVLVKGNTTVTDTIPQGTVVPAGATELRVYTANEAGESDDCVIVPLPLGVRSMTVGEEKLSFQMASDSHTMSGSSINQELNDEHFIDLLQDIAKFDPDSAGLFHGGDIVDNGKIAEYERFKEIWNTYSNGLALEGIIGNHEYWDTKTHADTVNNFANYTGIAITPETPYYTKNIGGYDFFFLNSSIIDPSGGNHNIATLGDTQLAWLDAGLAAVDAETPAFIFHHQKFNQIADADALKAILAKYPNAIFMTSHTHTDMNTAGIFEYENDAMCKTANTSAVSYTVYTHYNPNGENVNYRSQAYYVEIYEDRVLFRGMDIMTDEWLPSAQFVFWYGDVDTYPTDANLYPVAKNEADAVFEADFSELSALVASEAYSTAGAYVSTATDTAVNEWVNARFGLFMNQEGSAANYHALTHLGESTVNYVTGDSWGGDFQWNILSKGALLMNVSKYNNGNYYMGGQMMRKNLVLTAKGEDGNYLKFKDFEAEMVFNKAGANTLGAVFVSFRETIPGQYSVREGNASQNTAGTLALGVDGVIVGNAPTTYAYQAIGTDGIIAGNTDDGNNNNQIREPFTAALDNTADYKLTVKVIGSTLTAKVTKVSDGSVVYDNTASPVTIDNDAAGYLSFGVSNAVHEIKSVKVTKLNGMGLPVNIAQEDGYVGGNIETVDMVETDNGYQYTIEVTPDAGYELRAGTLIVEDKDGNRFVPTRVGYRAGGDASRYTVTIRGEGAVYAEFYQPTADDINIGWVGTSINEVESGLRFVHRVNVTNENGTLYMLIDGEKVEVAGYGLLIASQMVVKDPEHLSVKVADESMHVHKLEWPTTTKYYDLCDDYADIAVHIKGISDVGAENVNFITRVYVKLANGDVKYGDVAVTNYAAQA